MSIDEQLKYLRKGLSELIREEELRARLVQSEKTGRPMCVKAGFDPTASDLHLGHTVLLQNFRAVSATMPGDIGSSAADQ